MNIQDLLSGVYNDGTYRHVLTYGEKASKEIFDELKARAYELQKGGHVESVWDHDYKVDAGVSGTYDFLVDKIDKLVGSKSSSMSQAGTLDLIEKAIGGIDKHYGSASTMYAINGISQTGFYDLDLKGKIRHYGEYLDRSKSDDYTDGTAKEKAFQKFSDRMQSMVFNMEHGDLSSHRERLFMDDADELRKYKNTGLDIPIDSIPFLKYNRDRFEESISSINGADYVKFSDIENISVKLPPKYEKTIYNRKYDKEYKLSDIVRDDISDILKSIGSIDMSIDEDYLEYARILSGNVDAGNVQNLLGNGNIDMGFDEKLVSDYKEILKIPSDPRVYRTASNIAALNGELNVERYAFNKFREVYSGRYDAYPRPRSGVRGTIAEEALLAEKDIINTEYLKEISLNIKQEIEDQIGSRRVQAFKEVASKSFGNNFFQRRPSSTIIDNVKKYGIENVGDIKELIEQFEDINKHIEKAIMDDGYVMNLLNENELEDLQSIKNISKEIRSPHLGLIDKMNSVKEAASSIESDGVKKLIVSSLDNRIDAANEYLEKIPETKSVEEIISSKKEEVLKMIYDKSEMNRYNMTSDSISELKQYLFGMDDNISIDKVLREKKRIEWKDPENQFKTLFGSGGLSADTKIMLDGEFNPKAMDEALKYQFDNLEMTGEDAWLKFLDAKTDEVFDLINEYDMPSYYTMEAENYIIDKYTEEVKRFDAEKANREKNKNVLGFDDVNQGDNYINEDGERYVLIDKSRKDPVLGIDNDQYVYKSLNGSHHISYNSPEELYTKVDNIITEDMIKGYLIESGDLRMHSETYSKGIAGNIDFKGYEFVNGEYKKAYDNLNKWIEEIQAVDDTFKVDDKVRAKIKEFESTLKYEEQKHQELLNQRSEETTSPVPETTSDDIVNKETPRVEDNIEANKEPVVEKTIPKTTHDVNHTGYKETSRVRPPVVLDETDDILYDAVTKAESITGVTSKVLKGGAALIGGAGLLHAGMNFLEDKKAEKMMRTQNKKIDKQREEEYAETIRKRNAQEGMYYNLNQQLFANRSGHTNTYGGRRY